MKKNELLNIIKDYGITFCTVYASIVVFLLKLFSYIKELAFANYYKIDIHLVNFSNAILIDILIGIIVSYIVISFLNKAEKTFKEKKSRIKIAIIHILTISFIIFLANPIINIWYILTIVICSICLTLLLFLLLFFSQKFKTIEEKKEEELFKSNDFYKIIKKIIYCVVLISLAYLISFYSVMNMTFIFKNEMRIISNTNQAIIYTNKDYYLTLKFNYTQDGKIDLIKGSQNKVPNENIETEMKELYKN